MLSRLPSSPTKGVFSFTIPQEDLLEYLKACAPIACQDYGKTISHYGGLRITPEQDVEYAGWSKAKQLAWDRAYDENNELCYICYNGAGNSAYAGFMKILHGRKRRELCNGVDSLREKSCWGIPSSSQSACLPWQ